MTAFDWRSRAVIVTLILGWTVLTGRLVQLQWFQRAEFAEQARRQRVLYEEIPARPGDLLDRSGRLLATTVEALSLYAVPSRIDDPQKFARRVAEALRFDPGELTERLSSRRDREFLWIKRRLTPAEADRIRALNLPQATWGFREEYQRRYPQGSLAAHVLGLRDIDGIGRGGLEESLDAVLRGRPGRRVLIRDARGRVVELISEQSSPPQPGQSVSLTLDMVVQLDVERALDELIQTCQPKSACAVVVDPQSGEVLAMASRPAFDPNHPGDVPAEAWKNRVIADIYEPGSTFKPFVVAWAIEQDVIARDELLDCEQGQYRMGGRLLHDLHPYGELSITDVLVKSSNIGMAKIGERMGNPMLCQAAMSFGFGRKTGVELPGELEGLLRPLEKWTGYSLGSIPMGHELAVTPLQLIVAHAALANGGRWIRPQLVRPPPDSISSVVTSVTVGPETCRWIIEGPMLEVVNRGTGRKAQIPGYQVFGKTGTAQKLDPETGRYSASRHVSSFLCGAPAENPRVLVLVVVNEPTVTGEQFGGTIAAPAAAAILKNALLQLQVPYDEQLLRSAEQPDAGTAVE